MEEVIELVELGRLTSLAYRDEKSGRRRVLHFGLRSAPVLAYDPKKPKASCVIVYGTKPLARAPSSAALREYQRTHWGKEGAGVDVAGDVMLPPFHVLGAGLSVTYTTEKGGDASATDYEHTWGDGAKGSWLPPRVLEHRCKARGCRTQGRIALAGGTYRVTTHGIVG